MSNKQKQADQILKALKVLYPDAKCELNYRTAFELLVATILSAQCTDKRVNQVTQTLFIKYPRPIDFAQADLQALEQDIHSTGFFRNKAKSIQASARRIVSEYQGEVPSNMKALIALPGVGRKTASVLMGNAFGYAEGVVVDTHVGRLSQRLGLSESKTPEKIERDLMKLIPKRDWVIFPHLMIFHGRSVCKARQPKCQVCEIASLCPSRQ